MIPSSSSKIPRVFLSYASDAAQSAKRLRPLLKLAGFGPSLDSEAPSTEEARETAIRSSDFVVAVLSHGTRNSRQEQELRTAVEASRGGTDPGKPLVLQCAFSGTRNAAFDDIAPDFLRGSHALDFTDFDVGWRRLYESLYKAATLAGLSVPKLLRAAPRYEMDQADVARMVLEHGFFSNRMNASGGGQEAELILVPGGMIVDDRSSLRMWTRGCVDPSVLPRAPLQTADELAALMTPPSGRTDQQRALVEVRQNMARQMRLAIEEWTTKLKYRALGRIR